jgi:hypothetical protein
MTSLQDRQPTIIVLFPAGAWISLFSKPSRPTVEPIKSLQEQIRWHRSSAPERILTFTRGWLQSEYSEILLPLALIGSSAGAERVNAIRGCHSERFYQREIYSNFTAAYQRFHLLFLLKHDKLCYHCILHKLPDLWSTTNAQNGCRSMVHRTATAAAIWRTPSFFGVTKFPRHIHETIGLCSIGPFFDY